MKTVMVIPGAYAQIPLIKNLKLQGYKVVCVNPYENSPAFEYADYSDEVVPYDYNYTVLKRYSYEMPYSGDMKEIDFLQSGCRIEIPVDYLEAVTMRREELYD